MAAKIFPTTAEFISSTETLGFLHLLRISSLFPLLGSTFLSRKDFFVLPAGKIFCSHSNFHFILLPPRLIASFQSEKKVKADSMYFMFVISFTKPIFLAGKSPPKSWQNYDSVCWYFWKHICICYYGWYTKWWFSKLWWKIWREKWWHSQLRWYDIQHNWSEVWMHKDKG